MKPLFNPEALEQRVLLELRIRIQHIELKTLGPGDVAVVEYAGQQVYGTEHHIFHKEVEYTATMTGALFSSIYHRVQAACSNAGLTYSQAHIVVMYRPFKVAIGMTDNDAPVYHTSVAVVAFRSVAPEQQV